MPLEDGYVAATARRRGLTIVTGNAKTSGGVAASDFVKTRAIFRMGIFRVSAVEEQPVKICSLSLFSRGAKRSQMQP